MSSVDALIVALADGCTMRDAALLAGMPSAAAVREARIVGWPDLDAVRLAAQEIRERNAVTEPDDEPGCDDEHDTENHDRIDEAPPEETPDMPRKPEPIPIEPDVEQAMTAGASSIREARASIALDRDQTHAVLDKIPADLDRIVDRTDELETAREQRASIDAALIEDTAATLQLIERITTSPRQALGALTVEQRQRAVALREAYDITCGADPGPTVGDLLSLADYVVTGTVPVLIVRGVAQPGERAS